MNAERISTAIGAALLVAFVWSIFAPLVRAISALLL